MKLGTHLYRTNPKTYKFVGVLKYPINPNGVKITEGLKNNNFRNGYKIKVQDKLNTKI